LAEKTDNPAAADQLGARIVEGHEGRVVSEASQLEARRYPEAGLVFGQRRDSAGA
jgi:hypothetical protein